MRVPSVPLALLGLLAVVGCASTAPAENDNCPRPISSRALFNSELVSINASNLVDAMRGRIAGVNVVNDRGRRSIRVRGVGSFGSNDPLVVIDGMRMGMRGMTALESVNPRDVDFVEVLSNISDVSPFGLDGANGVVVVATRRAGCGLAPEDTTEAPTGPSVDPKRPAPPKLPPVRGARARPVLSTLP